MAGLYGHGCTTFATGELGRFTRWYGIDAEGVRRVQAAGLEPAVVFVEQAAWTDYAPSFAQHAPSLDGPVVYAIDLGDEQNRRIMALYPGRAAYRYGGGQLSHLGRPS